MPTAGGRRSGSLLVEPHHDTGPAYLLGERAVDGDLTARLWVPTCRGVTRVLLRQVVDGEPRVTELTNHPGSQGALGDHGTRGGSGAASGTRGEPTSQEPVSGTVPAGTWWEGTITLLNPVNHYRFLLLAPGTTTPYAWYHAGGVSDHDVPDSTDFRVSCLDRGPDWVLDAACYQVFPDRFSPSTDPASRPHPEWAVPTAWDTEPPVAGHAAGTAWYGGDLDGVTAHLDWIESLGLDTVYLTPVFPAGSVHRYDATTFEDVDPFLGGREALVRLARALHARGMRLVLDLTTNHTGVTHEWFRAALADAGAEEAGFYSFADHPGRYEAWLGVPSLPKLDHRSPGLRERLLTGPTSVTARWLAPPVLADGWRVDVANMTGRLGQVDLAHQVAQDMRDTMEAVEESTHRPTWLVAEHGHDASCDLTGTGWHGTMNYAGFTRPLWSWLSRPDPADGLTWLGVPTEIPHLDGDAVVEGVRRYTAELDAASLARSMNQLDSHDTPRIRTVVAGSRALHLVAATALFCAPGVPTVFMGDELGATGRTGEHSRTTIPWAAACGGEPEGCHPPDRPEGPDGSDVVRDEGSWGTVDRATLRRYRELGALRRRLTALRRGGTRWVHAEADIVAWLRTHPDGDVMVVLARAAHGPLTLDLDAVPTGAVAEVLALDGVTVDLAARTLTVTAHGAGSGVVVMAPVPRPDHAMAAQRRQ